MSVTVPAPVSPVAISREYASRLTDLYKDQLRTEFKLGRLFRLGVITAEFALVVVAIRATNIETPAFELVATIALGGFLIHHFLPARWRQNFFAALSVVSVPLVLGWEVGGWLLAIGGLLITLCHLPITLWKRIGIVLLVAVVLAAQRKHLLPGSSSIPTTIWPILGSMFMFRLIVYIYDLKHGAGPFSIGRTLSYFFMLPNVCFPLFPVVDYKTLQRSAYNDDSLLLYHTGVKWMLRGLVHLMLYKIIYFVGVIEPSEALSGLDAARYMIATFLLYLKISGLFHLIVGLLHMYGFGLAETHHLYMFSSSFTDFWRRINIYWKDFIQKLVFNPTYFSMRRLGETGAITVATLSAFGVTWLLHSYQWFWIRGEFPIVWADILFWFGLGGVVLINVLLENRKGRQRSLSKHIRSLRGDTILALKIAGTFASICILWTIWSTPDLGELALIWRAVLNSGPLDFAVLVGGPIGIGMVGALLRYRKREVFGVEVPAVDAAKVFWPQAAVVSVIAVGFIVAFQRPVLLEPLSPALAKVVTNMYHRVQFNVSDSKKLQRGYYEDLGDVTRFNSELWTMYGGRPPGWDTAPLSRDRSDGIQEEFIPSTTALVRQVKMTINSMGMRDREYPLEPGPNTFRIALVGASNDLGTGVGDDETYENVVEDRLNRELGPQTGKKYEILNFSHSHYSPTQKLSIIEKRIFGFKPDVVLYVANRTEFAWTFRSLNHIIKNNLLEEFPFIKSALEKADIKNTDRTLHSLRKLVKKHLLDQFSFVKAFFEKVGVNETAVFSGLESKLAPYTEDTLRSILERFRQGASARGIRPVLCLLEITGDSPTREKIFDRLVSLGQSSKLTVLDLHGSFSGKTDRTSLWIAPWDDHTNAEGHRLLADRLYNLLLQEELVATQTPAPR